MRDWCRADRCDEYPHYIRHGSRLEFPLLLIRKRENGTRGYSGMAREKPVELAGISDEAWEEFREHINSTIFTCPFSYGTTFFFVIIWFVIVATCDVLIFGAVGPSEYFWQAFWKCQSKHHMYHEDYTQEFCTQYSGWGAACMLSFFIIFCAGIFGYSYRQSRLLKRWRREVEPIIVSICKEHAPMFERYGYNVEMKRWKIIFRPTDGNRFNSFSTDIPPVVEESGIPMVISYRSHEQV